MCRNEKTDTAAAAELESEGAGERETTHLNFLID